MCSERLLQLWIPVAGNCQWTETVAVGDSSQFGRVEAEGLGAGLVCRCGVFLVGPQMTHLPSQSHPPLWEVQKVLELAALCMADQSSKRPTMSDILYLLREELLMTRRLAELQDLFIEVVVGESDGQHCVTLESEGSSRPADFLAYLEVTGRVISLISWAPTSSLGVIIVTRSHWWHLRSLPGTRRRDSFTWLTRRVDLTNTHLYLTNMQLHTVGRSRTT